jgi:hypothetical protein
MKKLIIIAIMLLAISACTDSGNAKRILKSQGYENIKITGYRFFSCSQDDTYHTGFEAQTQSGDAITGTVCSGIFFKNSTVRFD